MVVTPPDVVGPIMLGLLNCAREALIYHGAPCSRILLAPGAEVAWDDCCDGFLWVRKVSSWPTGNPFPQIDTRPGCNPVLIASTLGLGVLRCAAMIDDQGNAPSAVTLTAEALQVSMDAAILLEAIKCCLPDLTNVQTSVLGSWTPLGPQGGCTGGEWNVVIGHGTCPCPDPEED